MEHGGPCFFSLLFIFVAWIYTIFTNKQERTQIPQILIFFNKEYSVFLTFSVLLAGFHLLSSLSLVPTCPPRLPLHPHTPTSSPAVTKIGNFHTSSITGSEWSLSAVLRFHWEVLKIQCAALVLDPNLWPPPPTPGRSSPCRRWRPGKLKMPPQKRTDLFFFRITLCFLKRAPYKCNVDGFFCLFPGDWWPSHQLFITLSFLEGSGFFKLSCC